MVLVVECSSGECAERAWIFDRDGGYCRTHWDEMEAALHAEESRVTEEAGGPWPQTCPRRLSEYGPWQREEGLDTWDIRVQMHKGLRARHCSFCGSLHPDDFMRLVKEGWIVVATDKNYKCQPVGTAVSVVSHAARGGHAPAVVEYRPIETLRVGEMVLSYNPADMQFIRNGRRVLQVGSRPYAGDLVRVTAGSFTSRYTPDHLCVVRVAGGFNGYHVYLMKRGNSYRVGRCRGWSETQKTPGVLYRARTERADGVWVLAAFETQSEASLAEASLSWRYNLPGLTFQAANTSVHLDQSTLDRFWASVGDLSSSGKALLAEYGRDEVSPMWAPKTGRGFWRTRTVQMSAANLLDGMEMVTAEGASLPISVSREPYAGEVYSLAVEQNETYVADGLVTHNCYLGSPEPDGSSQETKFYYLHLSDDQRREFVDLYNERRMAVSEGGFYRLPFFMR